jgi:hypothetical protein
MNKKLDYINAKTDILPLSLVLGQITSIMGANSKRALELFNELKNPKNPDAPEIREKQAELASLRMGGEDMNIAGKCINLVMDKLTRDLTLVLQDRYPELRGEMDNIPVKPVPQKPIMIKKEATLNEPKPQVPAMREPVENKKGP